MLTSQYFGKILMVLFFLAVSNSAAMGKSPASQLSPEFLKNVKDIHVQIAEFQMTIRSQSTDLVDIEPAATIKLKCFNHCFSETFKDLQDILSSSTHSFCNPTFYMHKFTLKTANETRTIYMNFGGRQFKIDDQCYFSPKPVDYYIDSVGFLRWR